MPTKEKYKRIKADAERYQRLKEQKKEEQRKFRKESVFRYLTYKTNATVKNRGKFTPFDLWKLAKKQRLICVLSGRKLKSENISVDHIILLSNGGTNMIDNIQLVDKDVNFAKHCLTTDEFILLCHDVVKKSIRIET